EHHVLVAYADGDPEPAGLARLVRDDSEAEVAFEVVDEQHGRGIGTALAEALAADARAAGIVELHATVAGDNARAMSLLARISGGDALVQINVPDRVAPTSVRVSLNGRDVTSAFAVRANGGLQGLVTGLAVGENEVVATMPKAPAMHFTITNHPSGGAVFAGPQVQPWLCKTVAGFPAPTDAQCDAPAAYSYVYMDAASHTFKAYNPAAPPPAASIANTTTDQGTAVPYIVRLERGAMDRGLYDVAVLDNPAAPWTPWASQPGWNHKVLYQFGGGTAPWHPNGAPQNHLV